jgi:hypothetical protein
MRRVEAGTGRIWPSHYMVMDPAGAQVTLPGIHTTEPTFGLPATWIDAAMKEEAAVKGYPGSGLRPASHYSSGSGSLMTAGSGSMSGSSSSSSASSSSSLGSRGGIVSPMKVTRFQPNHVKKFSGIRGVMSAPAGCRDILDESGTVGE